MLRVAFDMAPDHEDYAALREAFIDAYEARMLRRMSGDLPQHVGVMLDGNRRWAKDAGQDLESGYHAGAAKIDEFLGWCHELGVRIVWELELEDIGDPDALDAAWEQGRQALHQRFQHGLDVEPGLGRDLDGVRGVDTDHVLDLFLHPGYVGGGQVDLVQDRDDLVVLLDGLIDVRKGLRLDTLTGIDHQDRAFAGGKRPADLVGEIDMARRVHQVDLIGLAIVCGIIQPYGLGLDGDTALALDIHAIEHLLLHLPVGEAAAELDQSIRQRGLAVVDMGDDREVPDMAEVGHVKRIPSKLLAGKIGPTGHCGNAETVGAALLQKR